MTESTIPSDMYSESLMLLHPRLAHNLILNRLKQAKLLNDDLADYFKELNAIQEQHIKSLIKLSKRFPSPSPTATETPTQFRLDQDHLQIQSPDSLKTLLHQELLQLIDCHSNHQALLQSQVELALRNSKSLGPTNQPRLKSLEEQLNRVTRPYEDAEVKLNRSSSKLHAVSSNPKKLQLLQARQAEDRSAFNQSKQNWSNQAPQVFKTYQSIDNKRLDDLFETFIKFETLQNDHYRQQLEISERSTLALVAFDIQEEMQRFALTNATISDQTTHSTAEPPRVANDDAATSTNIPTDTALPTSPVRPTPAPHHSPQSPSHSTLPSHTHSPRPTGPSQSPTKLSNSPTQLEPDALPIQHPQEQQQQQINQSFPFPFPTDVGSSSLSPLQSSQIQPSSKKDQTSTYDPNHPEIPKLNAPNIFVPVRSTPASPASLLDSSLPPRTLYVQSQKSIDSTSNQSQNLNSIDLSLSPRSIPQPPLSAAVSNHSIADKFFSRSRIVNILSRHGSHHPQNHNHKMFQSRRLSQSNLSLDRGPQSELNTPGLLSQSVDLSQPRRSFSLVDGPMSDNIYTPEPLKSPAASQTGSKSTWSASRFVPFLPGANPLRKRKTSQSIQRMASSSVRDLSQNKTTQYAKVDSEGFTIPPQNRDRTPWEQEADTEVLSVQAADSSSHHTAGPRNNALMNHESQDSDRQSVSGSGLNSFSIKALGEAETQDSEAERLAAIRKVQSTLASSFGSPLRELSATRRSNTALRARRMEGRGVTMYDASPTSNADPSTQPVRRGSVSDCPNPVEIQPEDIAPSSRPHGHSTPDNARAHTVQLSAFENPKLSPLRSPESSVDLRDEGRGRISRSDSVNSTTFTSTGFQNIGPLLRVGGMPGSNNPFLNASLSSALSNDPSAVPPDQLTSSVIEQKSQHLGSGSPKLMIVSEKLNVLMNQGSLMKLLVIGEVYVTRLLIDRIGDKSEKLHFKIRHSDRLEKVAFPHGLVSPFCSRITESSTTTDPNNDNQEYQLDLARFKALLLPDQKSFCILKYRLYFDCSRAGCEPAKVEMAYRHLPVIIIPRWRTSKDKTELVLNYQLSPEFQKFQSEQKREFFSLSSSQEEAKVGDLNQKEEEIQEFELSAVIYNPEINQTHTKKVKIIDQQSLPAGNFDASTNRITWKLVDRDQQNTEGNKGNLMEKFNGKIVCRFFHVPRDDDDDHDGQGKNGIGENGNQQEDGRGGFARENCGPIQVNWMLNHLNLTGIQVELDDNNEDLGLAAAFNPIDDVEKIVQTSTFLVH